MSTRIEKDFFFQAAVRFEEKFYINLYEFTLSMLVETENIREQNIAIERLDYFIHRILENSIFVYKEETKAIDAYEKAGIKICTTPEEPYDQIIALILLLKLNAIMENRLFITDMTFGSKLSDGVRFSVVSEIANDIFKEDGWHNSACTNIKNFEKINKSKDKIVKLFEYSDWADIGLSWKEKSKNSEKILIYDPEKKK